jgi:hypothetical protein
MVGIEPFDHLDGPHLRAMTVLLGSIVVDER